MANTMTELYEELYSGETLPKLKGYYWHCLPITPPSKGHILFDTISTVIQEIWKLSDLFVNNTKRSKKIVRHGIDFNFDKFCNFLPAYIMRRSGVPFIRAYRGDEITRTQADKVLELIGAIWRSQMRKVALNDREIFELTECDTILSNVGWQQPTPKYDYLEICLNKDPLTLPLHCIIKNFIIATEKELFPFFPSFLSTLPVIEPFIPPASVSIPLYTTPLPPPPPSLPVAEGPEKRYIRCDTCFEEHKALILKRKPNEIVSHYKEYHPDIALTALASSFHTYSIYDCFCGKQFPTYREVYEHQRLVHYNIYPFSTYKESQYRLRAFPRVSSTSFPSTSLLYNELEERRESSSFHQESLPPLFEGITLNSPSKKRSTMESDKEEEDSIPPLKTLRSTKELSDAIWPVFQQKFTSISETHQRIDSSRSIALIDNEAYYVCRNESKGDKIQGIKTYLERQELIPKDACLGIQNYATTVALNALRGDDTCRKFLDESNSLIQQSKTPLGMSLFVPTRPEMTLKDVTQYQTHNAVFRLLTLTICQVITLMHEASIK